MGMGTMDPWTMGDADDRPVDNGARCHGLCALLMMCVAGDGAADDGRCR